MKKQKQPKQTDVTASVNPKTPPTREQIEKRAHELYLTRGGTHGYDLDDWLQAERELKAEFSKMPGQASSSASQTNSAADSPTDRT